MPQATRPTGSEDAAKDFNSFGIGDPAPPLRTGKWLRGEPVIRFEPDRVYVVEFWSTWCGPCIQAIDHLNDLHLKFVNRNVVVIGQNVMDYDDDSTEQFVKNMGAKMSYRVVLDDRTLDRKGAMKTKWLVASKESGIPVAFVVNKEGRIAWIGHPNALNAALLDEVLEGRFDIAAYARQYQQAVARSEESGRRRERLSLAMEEKRWDDAEIILNETADLEKWSPGQVGLMRLQILLGRDDRDAAWRLVGVLSATHSDDMHLQNCLAWYLVTSGNTDSKGLELAQKIAEQANQIAGGKVAGVLDTLARVLFLQGKRAEAITVQQQAVDAGRDFEKHKLEEALDCYRSGVVPKP